MLRKTKEKGIYQSNTDNSTSLPFVLKSSLEMICLILGLPFFFAFVFSVEIVRNTTFMLCCWGVMVVVGFILNHCIRCGLIYRFYADHVEIVLPTSDDLTAAILHEDRDMNYHLSSGLRLKSCARENLCCVKMYPFLDRFIILVELRGCKSHPKDYYNWQHIVRNFGKVLVLNMNQSDAQAAYFLIDHYIINGDGMKTE